jgi:hypothetical protein
MTFFTVNCAENFESPNQWCGRHLSRSTSIFTRNLSQPDPISSLVHPVLQKSLNAVNEFELHELIVFAGLYWGSNSHQLSSGLWDIVYLEVSLTLRTSLGQLGESKICAM